ncbi:spore maturation protein [Amphibacillus xylanus]|uniref:spore maturation protein n=1 Tax=Amphibacillus xylanus TaxID=1449 RepID=UPI00059E79AD|nr:nucleoside recognition domain-containing protein [Amphibacillus xylanus]
MEFISMVSMVVIPLFVLIVLAIGTYKKLPTYDLFVEGGKEGLSMAVSLLPHLLGMLVSIAIFRSSGVLDYMIDLFAPILSFVQIPKDIIPLALTKPISGTAALAVTADLIKSFGPDSFIGRLASTMQGSSDTTLYVITVYFGSVGIKKMGDALKVGLLTDLIGIIIAIMIITILFG